MTMLKNTYNCDFISCFGKIKVKNCNFNGFTIYVGNSDTTKCENSSQISGCYTLYSYKYKITFDSNGEIVGADYYFI